MSIGAVGRGALGLGSPAPITADFVFVPTVAFTLAVGVPTVLENDAIPAPSKAFNFTAFVPNVNLGQTITVPSVSFTFTSFAPTAIGDETLSVPSQVFNFNAFPPAIGDGATISTPSKAFIFTANIPDIVFDSSLLARTINSSETGEAYIILLTIEHPSLATPVRVSNDPTQLLPVAGVRGTISSSIEYIFLPFEFVFPNQEPDTSPRAQLRIDNVSREISTTIDSITSSPTIQIQVVLSTTPDIVELELLDFKLQRTESNIFMVMGDITVEHFDLEPYPVGRFHPSGFAGLFAN